MTTAATPPAVSPPPQRPAEEAMRALIARSNNGSPQPTAAQNAQLGKDLVQLSSRADYLVSQSGDDAELKRIRDELTWKTSATTLGNIGKGPASAEGKPSTTTTQQTQRDGSVRSTTVDVTSQTYKRQQIFDGEVAIGGVVESVRERTITSSGGNDVTCGGPLPEIVKKERQTDTTVAAREVGMLSQSSDRTAVITRSDTTDIREEKESNHITTRAFSDSTGRYIAQVAKNDFQSVTTSADGVVKGAEFRNTITRTLLNLDTGEVTKSVETASSSTTVKTQTTGSGPNASSVQTISVRNDARTVSSSAGGPDDRTQVTEEVSSESATLQQTTKAGATTQKLTTAASSATTRAVGYDQAVAVAMTSVQNESASLDSRGAYAATASQRETAASFQPTARPAPEQCDPKPPVAQTPKTAVEHATTLTLSASVNVSAKGKVDVSLTEESLRTENGALSPALRARLSVSPPPPIGGAALISYIESSTENAKLSIKPSTKGNFNASAGDPRIGGSTVFADMSSSQLTASLTLSKGPWASVNAGTGAIAAGQQTKASGVTGVLKADARNTTITAASAISGRSFMASGGMSFMADGAGNLFKQLGTDGALERVTRLNVRV